VWFEDPGAGSLLLPAATDRGKPHSPCSFRRRLWPTPSPRGGRSGLEQASRSRDLAPHTTINGTIDAKEISSGTYTRGEWSERIKASWQKGVESIFETGRLLSDAKRELGHGRLRYLLRDNVRPSL